MGTRKLQETTLGGITKVSVEEFSQKQIINIYSGNDNVLEWRNINSGPEQEERYVEKDPDKWVYL